jgi:tRNA nucleotidyltransferase (CCA-adding enzyme)
MDFFRQLSGRRVFNELQLILQEENPAAAVARLNDFNLLKEVYPALVADKTMLALMNAVHQVVSWYDLLFLDESYMKWAVYFLALIHRCEKEQAQEICRRFELAPRLQRLFVESRASAQQCLHGLARSLPADPSTVYHWLAGFRTELILFMMAAADQEKVKKAISLYFTHLRRTTLFLKGEDLRQMGAPPGPIYREILQAVFDAKLNGQVKTREEELEFARKRLPG